MSISRTIVLYSGGAAASADVALAMRARERTIAKRWRTRCSLLVWRGAQNRGPTSGAPARDSRLTVSRRARRAGLLAQRRNGENHRGFDLPLGDRPVRLQQLRLAFVRDDLEAVALVEFDRP